MHCPAQSALTRVTAIFAAGLVLALAVFSASPDLHAWLHDHAHTPTAAPCDSDDSACAVTLFANGVHTPAIFCLPAPAEATPRATERNASDWIVCARPRYWLAPSHAPPVA